MAALLAGGAAGAASHYCDRCFHVHEEHEKCRLCGHLGRKVVFPGPTDKRPPVGEFAVRSFTMGDAPRPEAAGDFRLALLLRNRIFIKENGMRTGTAIVAASKRRTDYMEQDEFDLTAQHVLGTIADAPVSYARWRVVPANVVDPAASADTFIVLVDRLLTLPEYRKKGYASALLGTLLQNVVQQMLEMPEVAPRVLRTSLIIPISALCVPATYVARKVGMNVFGEAMASDPSGLVTCEDFIATGNCGGFQEFAISLSDMAEAYMRYTEAAAAAAGDASAAGGGAGAAAAAPRS